jgi:hypothetical protein
VSGHGLGQALLIRRSDVSRIRHEIRMRFA